MVDIIQKDIELWRLRVCRSKNNDKEHRQMLDKMTETLRYNQKKTIKATCDKNNTKDRHEKEKIFAFVVYTA